MGAYKRGNVWWIKYKHEGKTYRERTGRTKRLAEDALHIRKAEIAQGRFNIQAVKRSPRFETFAEEYLAWAKDHHRREGQFVRERLGRLLGFFGGRRLNEISAFLVERYKQERRREVRAATVNRDLTVLSSVLSKAVEWGKLVAHPMRGGKVKKLPGERARERVLSDEEEAALLKVSSPELQDFIVLAVETGMREGELCALTPGAIDLARGEVTLTRTKSGKMRRILLTSAARAIVVERSGGLAPGDALFPAATGQRPWRIRMAFRRARARAGIEGIRIHDLRHTFATRLVTGGADLVTVMTLLGHSDLRMVARYAHATGPSMRHAVRVLDERRGGGTTGGTVGRGEEGVRYVNS